MSGTVCLLVSLGVVALGARALYVGLKNDNMAAKAGGSFIAVIGILTGSPDFLDLSLIYVWINFIGTIAILKFVEFGSVDSTEEQVRA